MTDNEKFYTPEIEELRIGLEYFFRRKNPDEEYFPAIIKDGHHLADVTEFMKDESDYDIRVKRLDHDDILECGWEKGDSKYYSIIAPLGKKDWFLTLNPKIGLARIEHDTDDCLFYGSIPNKSVLKQVMKLLNI